MDATTLGKSRIMNFIFKPSGAVMESKLRKWLMPPEKTLRGAGIRPGQTVLEAGCGSGFFTLCAAEMIGDNGHLIALDPLSNFVDRVREKVLKAGLKNVEVVQRDALKTGLESASLDMVLLLGVLPFPTLPLSKLLPEMYRVLKPEGTVAVWMYPISFGVPNRIHQSGLFTKLGKKHGVYTFRRTEGSTAGDMEMPQET